MAKKIVALLLAAVMAFSLAACGKEGDPTQSTPSPTQGAGSENNGGDGSGDSGDGGIFEQDSEKWIYADDGIAYTADLTDIIPKETVTLTISSQTANTNAEQLGWFADVMLEKFNVKINTIQSKGDQFTTLMESGDLGDIVMFGEIGDNFKNAIKNGMLLNWDENDLMKKYAPYIYNLRDTDLKKVFEKSTAESNGVIYSIGNDVAAADPDKHQLFMYYPCLRWDLYKELGMPEIKTLEDYIDILADMQALEPTSDIGTKTYGVSLHTAWETTAFMVMYVKSTAAFYGWDEFHCGLYNSETHEFQGCLQEDGIYLRCLKFYNQLNQKGLVDPDSETNDWSAVSEAMTNGETFMDIFNYVGTYYNTDVHLAAGKAMVPIAAEDFTSLVYGFNSYGGNYQVAIGSKTEYPELCMAIINWLYTPEGTLTFLYGPQSKTADPADKEGAWYFDEDGYLCLTDIGNECYVTKDTEFHGMKFSDGTAAFNVQPWAKDAVNPQSKYGETYNCENWASYSGINNYDIINDYYTTYGVSTFDEYIEKNIDHAVVVPGTQYVSTTQSRTLKATWAYVYDIVKTGSWRAIYAKTDAEFDQIVAQMIKDADAAGYQDCLEYSLGEADLRTQAEAEALSD